MMSWMKDVQLLDIIEMMVCIEVEPGENLVNVGDLSHLFFIVQGGALEVIDKDDQHLGTISRSHIVGGEALLRFWYVAYTIRATEKSRLYVLDGVAFRKKVRFMMMEHVEQTRKYLDSVNLFDNLTSIQKDMLSQVHFTFFIKHSKIESNKTLIANFFFLRSCWLLLFNGFNFLRIFRLLPTKNTSMMRSCLNKGTLAMVKTFFQN